MHRTVDIQVRPTVQELAEEFTHLDDKDQGLFLDLVAKQMLRWDAGYREKQLVWLGQVIRGERYDSLPAFPDAAKLVDDLAAFAASQTKSTDGGER